MYYFYVDRNFIRSIIYTFTFSKYKYGNLENYLLEPFFFVSADVWKFSSGNDEYVRGARRSIAAENTSDIVAESISLFSSSRIE